MKTMAITDFKAHALHVLAQIAKTKETVLITKRGKPLVKIVPFLESRPVPGKLAEALVFENDVLSPLGEDLWEACK